MNEVSVLSLPGLTPYQKVWDLQKELLQKRIDNEISDTFIFCEHPPVVTRGRGLQFKEGLTEKSIPLIAPLPNNVEYFEIERGGDLTFHGPGQLVIYPIFKLSESQHFPKNDVTAFLRFFEKALIETLAEMFESKTTQNLLQVKDATGVWVGAKKIASIGIAVKKWVSYHGAAINLTTDLNFFRLITPCGFSSDVMTSLEQALGQKLDPEMTRKRFEDILVHRLNVVA